MKLKILFSTLLCLLLNMSSNNTCNESYCDGKFLVKGYTSGGYNFKLYDFSREGNVLKAKYFAQNAYQNYLNWKNKKKIMLIVPGAFSNSWKASGIPVGLCVDNGAIINRNLDNIMDGMVIVYNGSTQVGGIAVVDLSQKPVTVRKTYGSQESINYNVKTSNLDKEEFLKWGTRENVTLFQSQLLYSKDKTKNFNNLYYGKKAERRFLAICAKSNIVHHVIVDAPDLLELNLSAQFAKTVLEFDGFSVMYIINLDTGDKNVFYAFNGTSLVDLKPYKGINPDEARIEKSTNLLVYYFD